MDRGEAPARPRPSAEERRARDEERRAANRLRALVDEALAGRGITAPSDLAAFFGVPAREAEKLLRRYHWRGGDLALLRAAAARLGLPS